MEQPGKRGTQCVTYEACNRYQNACLPPRKTAIRLHAPGPPDAGGLAPSCSPSRYPRPPSRPPELPRGAPAGRGSRPARATAPPCAFRTLTAAPAGKEGVEELGRGAGGLSKPSMASRSFEQIFSVDTRTLLAAFGERGSERLERSFRFAPPSCACCQVNILDPPPARA